MFNNIIIDGISNTGKTVLLQNIQRSIIENDKYKYSNFFISEHLTERFFEEREINENLVAKHIVDILNVVKMLNNLHVNSPFNSKNIMHVYIERLFATFHSRGFLNEKFFIENEKIIDSLSIRHILLYISKTDLQCRLEKTLKMRNEIWRKYIFNNGGIMNFLEKLLKQQEDMLNFNEKILSKYIKTEVVNVITINDDFYKTMI